MTVITREYESTKPPPLRPLLGVRIQATGWRIEIWKKHGYAEAESESFIAAFSIIWFYWKQNMKAKFKRKRK